MQQILQELLPKPMDPPQIDVHITPDQIMQGFKIWKEQTLTSPSGLHLSLYKIWIQKTEDKEIMTAAEFFSIYAKLFNDALDIGYPLRIWETIHNLFILKES
eukprot:1111938-Ditylum_brightwellii.AAC.1